MSGTIIGLATAACVFGGTLIGLALRRLVPQDHLTPDSKDTVKVAAGMVSLMAALVLGLLVGSAKDKFDATNSAITEGGAKTIMLDRVLANYGPETKEMREQLRLGLAGMLALLWPEERGATLAGLKAFEQSPGIELLQQRLRLLKPETETQKVLLAEAQELTHDLVLIRWLQIERAQSSIPGAMLVILLFWLTMLYMSFGLFAPHNGTVVAAMLVGALSLATAMFLIVEMNHPMQGALKVSSAPFVKALEYLGR